MINEDSAHGLGRRDIEVGFGLSGYFPRTKEPEKGFVYEGGGGKCMAGPLGVHLLLGECTQLLVDGLE